MGLVDSPKVTQKVSLCSMSCPCCLARLDIVAKTKMVLGKNSRRADVSSAAKLNPRVKRSGRSG